MRDSALHKADSAEEVDRLLDEGWEVDRLGWMGATPLFRAAERGLTEVARTLLRRGANVQAKRPDDGLTALHFASTAEVATLLIESGADIETTDANGRSPLHFAAQFGRPDVAGLLVRSGAEVDRQTHDGMTPLHSAAQEGHAEVVRLLLAAGARVGHQDHRGRTPLHRAAWRGKAAVVTLLLRAGADPSLRNKAGQPARHEAERNGHQEVAKLLQDAEGEAGQVERALTSSPATSALRLVKLRAHPMRPEAISISEGATLHRWRLVENPEVVTGIQARHSWFTDLAVDPRGEFFAVTTPEPRIEVRRWDDLSVVAEVDCPTEGRRGLSAIDLSPDERWIAVADSWEQVHLIDRATSEIVSTVEGGEGTCSVRFDPTSRLLASACSFQGGGHVRLDGIEGGGLVPVTVLERSDTSTPGRRFVDTLVYLAFSPDGRLLALFETSAIYHEVRPEGWRGDVVLYDCGTGERRWTVSVDGEATGDRRPLADAGHEMGFFTEVAFLDDETLACGSAAGWVLLYRITDGRLVRRVQVHPRAPVVSLVVGPCGGALWAALGEGGGTVVRVPKEAE